MTPSLRDYQHVDVPNLREAMKPVRSRVLFDAHCAYGKGHLIAYIVRALAEAGWNVWVMTPRSDLVLDLTKRFCEWGIQHGIIADRSEHEWSPGLPVQLMTTQSASLHKDRFVNWTDKGWMAKPHLAIFDECDEWLAFQEWFYRLYPDCRGLGLTATAYGTQKVYPKVVKGPTITESTLARRLVPIYYYESRPVDPSSLIRKAGEGEEDYHNRFYELNKGQILGGFVENYGSHLQYRYNLVYSGEKGIGQGFTHWLTKQGIPATYIDSDTNRDDLYTWIIPRWREESGRVLVFPKFLGRGNDLPRADALTPICITRSRTLYEQVTGRIMRTMADREGTWLKDATGAPLKPNSVFFDHAAWIQEHGIIYQNDHVAVPRNIKMLGYKGESLRLTQQKDRTARTLHCQRCKAVFDIATNRVCPACGADQIKAWKPRVVCSREEYAALSEEAKQNAIEQIPATTTPLGFDAQTVEQKLKGKTKAQRRRLWAELRYYFITNFNAYRARNGTYPLDKKGQPKDPIRTAKGVYFGRFGEWPEFAWDKDEPVEYGTEVRAWVERRFKSAVEAKHASN